MAIKLPAQAKSIALRNVAVMTIFVSLFAALLLGYKVNLLLFTGLIALAWLVTPIASSFRYLYRKLAGDRRLP